MPNKNKYIAAVTVTVDATVPDIWVIWTDVSAWNTWDHGIEQSKLNGSFRAGNTFSLTPRGGEPLEVTLKTVTQGEEFSDEAVLPFGSIRNFHRVEPLGRKVKLTHEVHAEINEEEAEFFEKNIWPHMQGGLAESVGNIANLVQVS